MTIDLTPAELREFVRLWKLPEWNPEGKLDPMRKRMEPELGDVVVPLALALADAMEEGDKALTDLEAAREAIRLLHKLSKDLFAASGITTKEFDGDPATTVVYGVDITTAVRAAREGR